MHRTACLLTCITLCTPIVALARPHDDAPIPSLGDLLEFPALPKPADPLDEPPPNPFNPEARPRLTALTLYWENDGAQLKRFDLTDRHYTNGLKIEASFQPALIPEFGAWLDSWYSLGAPTERTAGSIAITQLIMTPEDILDPELIEDDRPYAGYLALSLTHQRRAATTFDHVQLDIGVIGEWSGAEGLQKAIHAAVPNEPRPEGWSHQLANELGVNLMYQRRWRSRQLPILAWLHADAIPHVGFQLGNVWTNASAGATVRLGYRLPDDFGPPRLLEFRDATYIQNPNHRWHLYTFGRLSAKAVARDIFLDGNTFANSHSVDSKPFVGEATAGLAFRYKAFELAYSFTFMTDEFEQQEGTDAWGSLAMTWNFDF